MLRSVCFNNFVKFTEYQIIDFSHDGPFIFIGENASGKSSVFEGIRRCLKAELSSSASSSPNANQLSYFICNFDRSSVEEDNVICGIVVIPEEREENDSESETDESSSDVGTGNLFGGTEAPCQETPDGEQGESNETQDLGKEKKSAYQADSLKNKTRERDDKNSCTKLLYRMMQPWTSIASWFMWFMSFFYSPKTDTKVVKTYYKFAMKKSGPMHVNLMQVTQSNEGDSCIKTINLNDITDDDFPEKRQSFINAVIKQKRTDEDIKKYLRRVFDSKHVEETNKKQEKPSNDCKKLLEALSKEIVFTFPLRSIGPLQWSESKRIHQDQRKNNYSEAEKRCEIIKCYLEDFDGTKFDKDTEQDIFKTITQCDDYNFELKDGHITLPKGKYALLKTPEGILEAKVISILMSGRKYRTIILEEPDRGMHPQFIERMVQVINQYKKSKRVILTTHNTSLITPWTLPNCFVFKRQGANCRIISGRTIIGAPTVDNVQMKKLRLVASDHVSDILFAKKVLFFEGDSELLFLTEFRRQVLADELTGINIFKDNERFYNQLKKSLLEVTLIKMNGKGNAEFCHNVCKDKLELGHLIIVDRDAIKVEERREKEEKTEEEKEHKVNKKDGDVDLHQNAGTELQTKAQGSRYEKDQRELVWERKEQLKKNNTFFWLNGDVEDMVIEMSFTSKGLLEKLKEQNVSLDVKQYQKKEEKKRHQKLFLRRPVTISNITEGTKLIFENCTVNHDLFQLITYIKQDNWDIFSD